MVTAQFDFKKANRFFPHILLVGLGIGTANYILNSDLKWIQWSIQALATSLLIGYTLVVIGLNKSWFRASIKPKGKLYLILFLAFFAVGMLATEVEQIIRSLVFHSQEYRPFTAGKMYLFNGIISLILGFSFFHNRYTTTENLKTETDKQGLESSDTATVEDQSVSDPITKVPVKQGENIFLIPIQEIVYFEAYDNYSFVYDLRGEKKLCDYSLLFFEKRLNTTFSRVHRKYIVNSAHIKQIKPHLNGRYLILFGVAGLEPITSSKSYSGAIRKLIKIE